MTTTDHPETDLHLDVRHPAAGSGATWPVFEVFRQEREGKPMEHAGNVLAPDAAFALLYAREFYGRRQESVRIWVVPRDQIQEIVDDDLLRPPAVDRSYRTVGGYRVRDALDAARAHATGPVPGSAGRKARPAGPTAAPDPDDAAMKIPDDV
jgi:phenylacetate-CoA oxygenase PaaH subunit